MTPRQPTVHLDAHARRFALRFLAFAAVGFTIYCFPYAPDGSVQAIFAAYLSAYARAAGFLLSRLESGISVTGTTIAGRTALEIVKNCDAMEIMLLFAAAALALEGSWRQRTIALVAGLAAIVALNLTRICSLYYVEIYYPDAFDVVHLEIWPPVLLAFTSLQFLAWARWLDARSQGAAHATH